MKNFFIPNKNNNYHPLLLRKASLAAYLVIVLLINFSTGLLPASRVRAEVNANELYRLHNAERLRNGLSELRVNSDLIESATTKAEAMLASNCWSHYCPDGKSPWSFFDESGYVYVYAGENLAEGFEDDEEVMAAWLDSPTHKENILKAEFNEIGIGFARGDFQGIHNNLIVVVHFGARTDTALENLPLSNSQTGGVNVEITLPISGSSTSDTRFQIEGIAPADSSVDIDSNGSTIGRVNAEGQNFSFRPIKSFTEGNYTIQAHAYDNSGSYLGSSAGVSVTVDTTKPVLYPETFKTQSVIYTPEEIAVLSVKTNTDAATLKTSIPGTSFNRIADDNWEMEVATSQLQNYGNLELQAIDAAGNSSSVFITVKDILSQISSIKQQTRFDTTLVSENILNSLISRIKFEDTNVQLNILFSLFLGSLFAVDFYSLSKSGLTGIDRSKSHLHLSSIVLIILISLIGGIGGNILNGLEAIK